MTWPFMPNRMQRTMLFAALASKSPDFTIDRWGEYRSDLPGLPPDAIPEIDRAADVIAASFNTPYPIHAVLIQGHADYDMRRKDGDRYQFEREISQARAREIRKRLMDTLSRRIMSPAQRQLLGILFVTTEGLGSEERVRTHPKNEYERSLNRRVEIFFAKTARPARLIRCPHGGPVTRFARGTASTSDTWIVDGCSHEIFDLRGKQVPSPCFMVRWLAAPDEEVDADSIGMCYTAMGMAQGFAIVG